MRRYILTGAPGAGKTTILRWLRERGFDVVDEAATAVIARGQAAGIAEPWTREDFLDQVVAVQRLRQTLGSPAGEAAVRLHDRSPICTHALSVHLGRPVPRVLSDEIDRVIRERVYERQVFFVRNIGFCELTAARRISFQESLVFERTHEQSYRRFGYELVDVPPGDVAERATLIADTIARLAE